MKTKHIILIIIFSFASVYTYSQSEKKYVNSIELGINNHYLLSDFYNTDFNYGVSLLYNWNWEKFRPRSRKVYPVLAGTAYCGSKKNHLR
jgi:hypothetical protein